MLIQYFLRFARYFLFWILILAALLLSAVRIFLVDFSHNKTELVEKIRDFTHMPVQVGEMHSGIHYFTPELILQDFTIAGTDAGSEPAITLKEVRIGIDLLQLLWTTDFLKSSTVTLIGARLDLVKTVDGNIIIKGLASGDGQPTWLLQGQKYQILHSEISWQDLGAQRELLVFKDVDVILKNDQENHEIHVLTALPEQFGDVLRVSAILHGNAFELADINGQLYVETTNLQSSALAAFKLQQQVNILSGSGDVRLWVDVKQSQPVRIAGYLQAQQLRLANAGKSITLDTLQANLSCLLNDQGWRLGVYGLNMVANKQRWMNGEFYWHQDLQGNQAAYIKQLNLAALAYLTPIFAEQINQFDSWLNPNLRGVLNDLTLYVQADRQQYALTGAFSQLGFESEKSETQLHGLSGRVSGNNGRGQIDLLSKQLTVELPELFRNKLVFTDISGRMHWQQAIDGWQFNGAHLKIASADFVTESDFDLFIPNHTENTLSPRLNLTMSFGEFHNLSKLAKYLPAKTMGKDALSWLDQAFITGQINHGQLLINGNLDEFPFANGQGTFDALFTIENTELQFNPDWPHIHELDADLHFSGADLQVAVHAGTSESVEIKQAIINIADVVNSKEVEIKGVLQSKIQGALLYLQDSPLRSRVDALLRNFLFDGVTVVDLDLRVPYLIKDPLFVNVVTHLQDANLTIKPVNLKIRDIDGNIHFSEDRVDSQTLTANGLGYPMQAVLSSDNTATRLQVNGVTNMENLQRQFSFLQNDFSKGALNFQADLTVPYAVNQATTLNISSNLQGLAIDSQSFLAKTSEEQRLFNLTFSFDSPVMLPLQLQYGNDLKAALLVDMQDGRLYAGHLVFGNTLPTIPHDPGLILEIRQPEFKLANAFGALSERNNRWPPLREVILDTQQMIWQGQNLGALACHFQHVNQGWQGEIANSMAKGRLSIPDQYAGNDPIKLNMEFMNLTAMSSLNFSAAEQVLTVLPLIDIDSQAVYWRTVNLGKLKLQTERLNNGTHFKKILFSGANNEIDFTADWIKQQQGTSTLLNGSMKVNNFGQFLSELGYSDDFKETEAEIKFTGGWNDAPQQFALDKLNGQMHIKLNDGRISSIEPGFGRLLGLMSMEQWAKRLSLDFSDLYRQGLAFDQITGDFKIINGVVSTDNLLVDAVAAKMQLQGNANLINKTVDQRVTVIPKSSDALPIAGTIVDGIASVITNAVTNDYKEGYFFGSEYKVSGRWGNIEVTPLKEKEGLVNKTWHGLTNFDWLKK